MKRTKFSEQQIITILKEAESGLKVADLCRQHGMSQSTFFKWKSKYGGLEVSELRRIKQLEEENHRLKRMFADLSLDHHALKDVMSKKG
jgi:putative transposase